MEQLIPHDASAILYGKIEQLTNALYNYMVSNGIAPKSTKISDLIVAIQEAYPLAKIRKDLLELLKQNELPPLIDVVKALEVLKAELNGAAAKNAIRAYVKENGGLIEGDKLINAINGLKTIRVIKPGKKYIAFEVNEAGYIVDHFVADAIIEEAVLPSDVDRGYFYYENGKIKLDEARKALLWGD